MSTNTINLKKTKVSTEVIESFLGGNNPKKYVVGVEASYNEPSVDLIINEPGFEKRIEKCNYKPFIWFKYEVSQMLYDGNRLKIIEASAKHGVKITKLRVSDENGFTPKRLGSGYRFLATCTKSYNDLINFFKYGGIDVFDKSVSKLFFMFSPVEQFMIQTGIRLFKGMDDYEDIHRFQFDLETEGLFGSKDAIFQIGVRDNRGFEYVFETKGNTPQEKRDSERDNIRRFFEVIDIIKPDVITGYNSESFDWKFIMDRGERLNLDINQLAVGLDGRSKIKRKPSMLKLGNETEPFDQTYIYGYNIIDIAHSVRRAQAINTDIKFWNLKYITKYSEIAKKNRVYIPGDKIHTIWADKTNQYAFNDTNGDWYRISDRMQLKEDYVIVEGAFLIRRYLLDDLWETEQIDTRFNQASFLISKILPTTYSRSSTMGTASQWKLIMAAWSYENGLAIPETESKRDFTGGLSRLLQVGYARDVVKMDYAALYPKTQLTHDIFPELDISGVMEGMLTYVVDTRDKYKFLAGEHKDIVKDIKKKIESGKATPEELLILKEDLKKNKTLQELFDKKQLPLKILANSWFGAYGAPYIFNWGDSDCAEETTCRGRQYFRLMVRHFTEKYNFRATVGDSVTFDTPVYIKYNNGDFDIQPICDLFNENSESIDSEGLRDFEKKQFQILTVNGWKEINYVYKHETDKIIHRIITKDRLINVTEDHSLFQNQIQIKPSVLKRGDMIDVFNPSDIFQQTNTITEKKAWLYGFFLGDGSANCSKRKQSRYTSKKTGLLRTYFVKRSDWKISNSRIPFLEQLKTILKDEFNEIGIIKDHMKSSSVYNLVVHNAEFTNEFCDNFYTSYREKKVPCFILNSSLNIKRAFIEGVCASDGYGDTIDTCVSIGMKSQIAMAAIALIMRELGIEYKIQTRNDKPNFITFHLKNRLGSIGGGNVYIKPFGGRELKKTNEVWINDKILNRNKFVYDISTEDGTFIGGIGMINLKNTDGVNFAYPKITDEVRYVARGSHWKTTSNAGKELSGLEAVLAEFNEEFMIGRMGLDIDDIITSTINLSRKNYANDVSGKIKFVGNSIKSKKMPVYIEEFLSKAIRLLLDGKGQEFISYYYEYVDKIYNYNIPMVKIASKSKVRSTIVEYKKKANKKNKAGNPMPKQAHMELALINKLDLNLGDTLYYVNTGSGKSIGDIKTIKKENGASEMQINCKLIDQSIVDINLEMIKEIETLNKILLDTQDAERIQQVKTDIENMEAGLMREEYNVAKYLESFNKKVKPLLVCFNLDIRHKILLTIKKNKKTKLEKLDDRNIYTESQCELISGMPNKPEDQDTYEELMTMEDKEIKFWDKVNKVPNNMPEDEWDVIRADYHVRMIKAREDGIESEKDTLDDLFKRLELEELRKIETSISLPLDIIQLVTVNDDGQFVSRKWDAVLCPMEDIFKYEQDAIQRNKWYQSESNSSAERYQQWLDYKSEQSVMVGDLSIKNVELPKKETLELLKEKIPTIEVPKIIYKKLKPMDDDEDEEEIEDEIDDFVIDLQKAEFNIEIALVKDAIIPLSEPQKIKLEEVAEKLKDKVLFPEKIEEAKKFMKTAVFKKPELDGDGWNF